MRPFRGSRYCRGLAEECRTVAEVGPSQWKASYLRLAESYETLGKEVEAASVAVSAGAKIPHWKQPNGSVAPE
jgi:hypothetical protein